MRPVGITFRGSRSPYDVPINADLVVDSESVGVTEGVKKVIDLLRQREAI